MTDEIKNIVDLSPVVLEQIRSVEPTTLPHTRFIGYAQEAIVRIPFGEKIDFEVIKFESSISDKGKRNKVELDGDGGYAWGTKVIVNILEDGYAMVEV